MNVSIIERVHFMAIEASDGPGGERAMNLRTAAELLRSGQMRLLMAAMRLLAPYYRLI